jgi:hypothetical protein
MDGSTNASTTNQTGNASTNAATTTSNARQQHGLNFEAWLKKTFFEPLRPSGYTDKWDIDNYIFKAKYGAHTLCFGSLPISVKTCKYGSPIGFGDALRQYQNTQDFLLIVGFWQQNGKTKKYVAVKAVAVSAKAWKALFSEKISTADLERDSIEDEYEIMNSKIRKLDSVIKDRTTDYRKARQLAKDAKSEMPAIDIVLNPKIDSKNQRRLQCSLPFKVFWNNLAKVPPFTDQNCTFWGEKVPELE